MARPANPRRSDDAAELSDQPKRRAMSPAPSHPRQKQRGGSGPDQVGGPAVRRKQRGGTFPEGDA